MWIRIGSQNIDRPRKIEKIFRSDSRRGWRHHKIVVEFKGEVESVF